MWYICNDFPPFFSVVSRRSFGIMLYELLLLGQHPFDGASTADLVRGIMNEDPPEAPSMYSKDLIEVATRLLTKDPATRMTMTEFLTSPVMQHKVAGVPNNYKPKYHMEERFRRAQVRQLTQQVEQLGIAPKGSHGAHGHIHQHGSAAHIHGNSFHFRVYSIVYSLLHLTINSLCI